MIMRRRMEKEEREGGAGSLCWQGRLCLIPLYIGQRNWQVSLRPRSGRHRLLLWRFPRPPAKGAWRLNRSSFHRGQHAGKSTSSHHLMSLSSMSGVCLWFLLPPGGSPGILSWSKASLHPGSRPGRSWHLRGQLHHLHCHLHLM